MKKNIFKLCFVFVMLFLVVSNGKALDDEKSVKSSGLPTPIYGNQLIGGVGNVGIYLDNNNNNLPRATYWRRLINDAVNNWMFTGYGANPFYANYDTSYSNSKIYLYANDKSYWAENANNVYAQTYFYNSNDTEIDPKQSNWHHATIRLNDTLLRLDTVSDEQATGIIAHELGHAFGLEHNNVNEYSIMCQSIAKVGSMIMRRKVQTVQKVDNDALNRIYNKY